MKIEEKLKNKYLYKKGFNIFKFFYFLSQKIKYSNHFKKSYSVAAQDLIVDYFFKKKGVFISMLAAFILSKETTQKYYMIKDGQV
ncbi:hypothetical protein OA248_01420 [Candidatus Pelagibacter sp.]|nr:hypothetical protein [Candidatus Pelagibacter sp.]